MTLKVSEVTAGCWGRRGAHLLWARPRGPSCLLGVVSSSVPRSGGHVWFAMLGGIAGCLRPRARLPPGVCWSLLWTGMPEAGGRVPAAGGAGAPRHLGLAGKPAAPTALSEGPGRRLLAASGPRHLAAHTGVPLSPAHQAAPALTGDLPWFLLRQGHT